MALLLALHVSTLGYTLPASSSSLHPSIRPPTIFCALDVTALPPAGFVWGESFVFDEDAATSPTTAPSVVQSWYDAGVRLDTPKESLRRSRLNAPAETTETRTEFSKGFSIEAVNQMASDGGRKKAKAKLSSSSTKPAASDFITNPKSSGECSTTPLPT